MKRKACAVVSCILLFCSLLCGCTSNDTTVTRDSDGNYVADCFAECSIIEQNLTYKVSLKLTADENGSIVQVEDNGTNVPEDKAGAYQLAEGLFSTLIGKNADQLKEVDAISGATYSSDAILYAVQQGLDAINEARQSQ